MALLRLAQLCEMDGEGLRDQLMCVTWPMFYRWLERHVLGDDQNRWCCRCFIVCVMYSYVVFMYYIFEQKQERCCFSAAVCLITNMFLLVLYQTACFKQSICIIFWHLPIKEGWGGRSVRGSGLFWQKTTPSNDKSWTRWDPVPCSVWKKKKYEVLGRSIPFEPSPLDLYSFMNHIGPYPLIRCVCRWCTRHDSWCIRRKALHWMAWLERNVRFFEHSCDMLSLWHSIQFLMCSYTFLEKMMVLQLWG